MDQVRAVDVGDLRGCLSRRIRQGRAADIPPYADRAQILFALVIPADEQLGLLVDVVVEADAGLPAVRRGPEEVLVIRPGGVGGRIGIRRGVGLEIDQRIRIISDLGIMPFGKLKLAQPPWLLPQGTTLALPCAAAKPGPRLARYAGLKFPLSISVVGMK